MTDSAWMIRAGNNNELVDVFVENSLAAVGWVGVGDLSDRRTREDIKERYRAAYEKRKQGRVNTDAAQLHAFKNRIEEGDLVLPSTKDPESTVAFTTNQPLESPQEAKGQVNRYARRWGIENSYKTIKDFLAWTTSKEFVVRFFYFGFAVLLYNMWLLVDLLVQLSLDVEHRYKPRVTAKRFLNLARKQLAEPG